MEEASRQARFRKPFVVKRADFGDRTMEEMGSWIKDRLQREGIIHFKDPSGAMSPYDFFDIARALGQVWDEKHIVIDPSRKEFVHSPKQVPFHTDSIKANVIGWYCVNPGDGEVTETLYLDGSSVIEILSAEERLLAKDFLCRDPLQYKTAADDVGPFEPVVTTEGSEKVSKVFWIGHRVQCREGCEASEALLAKVKRLMQGNTDEDERGPIMYRLKLRRGDFIFVNNNKILHARGPVSQHSTRHLYRLYINTDGWLAESNNQDLLVETPHPEYDGRRKQRGEAMTWLSLMCCFIDDVNN